MKDQNGSVLSRAASLLHSEISIGRMSQLLFKWKSECYLLSSVQLFVTPWTVACQAPLSMDFFGQSPEGFSGVGSHSLLQGIFLTQGSDPRLLHCRHILYHLSQQVLLPNSRDISVNHYFYHQIGKQNQRETIFKIPELWWWFILVAKSVLVSVPVIPWTIACQTPLSVGFSR